MEKKQFKGWGILVAAFIMSFIPTAVLNNCFALYMNPVCTDLGIAVGSWSLVNLIASLTSAIGAIVVAGLYQKKNMKLMMVLCSLIPAGLFIVGLEEKPLVAFLPLTASCVLFLGTLIIGDRRARIELKRRFHIH